jgi:chemotaxis protein CheX
MTVAKLDINFAKPFLLATVKTLKLQCNVMATAGKPADITGKSHPLKINIAGIIGVTSPKFVGSIALCFPEQTFLGVIGKMLDETYTEINSELEDGACELLNIIYGSAKVDLNKLGHQLEKAIPSVVRGTNINVKHVSDSPTILIPFETEMGPFSVDINLQSTGGQDAA